MGIIVLVAYIICVAILINVLPLIGYVGRMGEEDEILACKISSYYSRFPKILLFLWDVISRKRMGAILIKLDEEK